MLSQLLTRFVDEFMQVVRGDSLQTRVKRSPIRLRLEQLETRAVPATFTWKQTLGNNWSEPTNWAKVGLGGAVPAANDSVVFDGTSITASTDDIAALTIKNLSLTNAYTGAGAVVTLSNDLTIGGGGSASIAAGKITGTGKLSVPTAESSISLLGGTLDVATTLGADGVNNPTLTIQGIVTISQTFTNNGQGIWFGGNVALNAQFKNQGGATFDIQGGDLSTITVGNPPAFFSNAGTFKKSQGNGISSFNGDFRNTSIVQFNSGTVAFTGAGGVDTFSQSAGSTALNGGAFSTVGGFNLSGGTLTGTGTVGGDVNNTGGNVMPGINAGPGNLNVTGKYTQGTSGVLTIYVTAGPTSLLNVTGAATLDGTLNVNKPVDYNPAFGTDLTFLRFASLTGDFATKTISNNTPWVSGVHTVAFSARKHDTSYSLLVDTLS